MKKKILTIGMTVAMATVLMAGCTESAKVTYNMKQKTSTFSGGLQ